MSEEGIDKVLGRNRAREPAIGSLRYRPQPLPMLIKKLIALLCLVGSALALYNVYSDIGPVQMKAEAVACGTSGCAQLVGMQRSPISAQFRFQVKANQSLVASVECKRGLILLGEYTCVSQ